jgi:hypothetical protein
VTLKPDDIRLVSLTNVEILTIIDYMRKVIPIKEEEKIIVGIVDKLNKTLLK